MRPRSIKMRLDRLEAQKIRIPSVFRYDGLDPLSKAKALARIRESGVKGALLVPVIPPDQWLQFAQGISSNP